MKFANLLSIVCLMMLGISSRTHAQSQPPTPSSVIKLKLIDSVGVSSKLDSLERSSFLAPNSFVKKMGTGNGLKQSAQMPNAYAKANDTSIAMPTIKINVDTF